MGCTSCPDCTRRQMRRPCALNLAHALYTPALAKHSKTSLCDSHPDGAARNTNRISYKRCNAPLASRCLVPFILLAPCTHLHHALLKVDKLPCIQDDSTIYTRTLAENLVHNHEGTVWAHCLSTRKEHLRELLATIREVSKNSAKLNTASESLATLGVSQSTSTVSHCSVRPSGTVT